MKSLNESKFCPSCKIDKSTSLFFKDKSNHRGLAGWCKTCAAKKKRIYYRKNPHKHREEDRRQNLKRKFNMTIEEYDQLAERQGYACAICHKSCATGNRLAVDHCHVTDKVRGLLCYRCNTHLGWFENHKNEVIGYLHELLKGKE